MWEQLAGAVASDHFGYGNSASNNTGGLMQGSIGHAAAANAYGNIQEAYQAQMRKRFELEEVENGVILYYGPKKYVCGSMDEAFDRAKACMVEERINK